jgi:putative YhbY family RNA-binding protein
MPRTLSAADRQALKARAHPLRPVVMVGAEGVTEGVLRELGVALAAHELVKVRVLEGNREDREAILAALCAAAEASPVQHIGKILVLFREQPQVADARAEERPPRRASRGTSPAVVDSVRRRPTAGTAGATGRRWTLTRAEGRPGRAPKQASRGRKAVRRIGGRKARAR